MASVSVRTSNNQLVPVPPHVFTQFSSLEEPVENSDGSVGCDAQTLRQVIELCGDRMSEETEQERRLSQLPQAQLFLVIQAANTLGIQSLM
ncbi:hypothetical protein FRC07_014169 [Ceratobasidium sp. 392]|nr:hypothetical protein FRC07_014169 [Ceratobasidium sp. 392]